jgi:hypothetical protein
MGVRNKYQIVGPVTLIHISHAKHNVTVQIDTSKINKAKEMIWFLATTGIPGYLYVRAYKDDKFYYLASYLFDNKSKRIILSFFTDTK